MAIAYPISEGRNVIKFHDREFDINKDYRIKLQAVNFCFPSIVLELDDVFFCEEYVNVDFDLPCTDAGLYRLKIYDEIDPSVILYNINVHIQ